MADMIPVPAGAAAAMTMRAFPAVVTAWQSLGTRPPADARLRETWRAVGTFLWFWYGHGTCTGWRFDPDTQELLCTGCGQSVLDARDPASGAAA